MSSSIDETTVSRSRKSRPRRVRKPINCKPCRESKLRCDRQLPCGSCRRRDLVDCCVYRNVHKDSGSALAETTPILQPPRIGNQAWESSHILSPPSLPTAENRAADDSHARWDEVFERPTEVCSSPTEQTGSVPHLQRVCFPFSLGPPIPKRDLLALLPPRECCDYLITQYFWRLSPLFHVLHGPTFQRQYNRFMENQEDVGLSWLALLFTICSITLNTLEEDDAILSQVSPREPNLQSVSTVAMQLHNAAMVCLSQDQFLMRHSLNTLETLLIMIYGMSHHEGVEQTWVLLGMALNIGIALRCNVKTKPPYMGWIECERRRRCWAGVLMLHTYQAILFRDVHVSSLLDMESTMPADVNDSDIQDDMILQPSSQPTQMSVIMCKLRMFKLSSRICDYLSADGHIDEHRLASLEAEVAQEQTSWDAKFLLDGQPSLLDIPSYAHWCILQQYAHQLYLLLHRAFCRPRPNYPPRVESQLKCISSGAALLEIHRQFYEVPRLRNYRWYIYGMTSFCALHGAVALASCLLMRPTPPLESSAYRAAFDATVLRFKALRAQSPVCAKSYPMLRHLQDVLSPDKVDLPQDTGVDFGNVFDEWIDTVPWLNIDSVDWDALNGVLDGTSQ